MQIRENGFGEPCPLDHARRNGLPLRRVDQQGNVAERPGAFLRLTVSAEEDAGVAHVAVGIREATVELARRQRREAVEKALPMRSHPPAWIDALVERSRQRLVGLDQMIETRRGRGVSPRAGRHRLAPARMT